jgi:hypothetical protein
MLILRMIIGVAFVRTFLILYLNLDMLASSLIWNILFDLDTVKRWPCLTIDLMQYRIYIIIYFPLQCSAAVIIYMLCVSILNAKFIYCIDK